MPNTKKLELEVEVVSGTSKEGKEYSFPKYFVTVNGIELQVKPADNTVSQVLKQAYGIE